MIINDYAPGIMFQEHNLKSFLQKFKNAPADPPYRTSQHAPLP